MWWTASVNLYQNGDDVRYSVRLWRVGEARRTLHKPDVHFTGSVPAPLHESPQKWIHGVLVRLSESL